MSRSKEPLTWKGRLYCRISMRLWRWQMKRIENNGTLMPWERLVIRWSDWALNKFYPPDPIY